MWQTWVGAGVAARTVACLTPATFGMTGFHNMPREIRDFILVEVEDTDLVALGKAAKLTYAVAVTRLYRKISMTDFGRVLLFLRTVKGSKTLASLVLHLELHWEPRPTEALAKLATQLCNVLPKLSNLVHLTISTALEKFRWIYETLNLPSLREFHAFTPVNAQCALTL